MRHSCVLLVRNSGRLDDVSKHKETCASSVHVQKCMGWVGCSAVMELAKQEESCKFNSPWWRWAEEKKRKEEKERPKKKKSLNMLYK